MNTLPEFIKRLDDESMINLFYVGAGICLLAISEMKQRGMTSEQVNKIIDLTKEYVKNQIIDSVAML